MKAPHFWTTNNGIARSMAPLSKLFSLGRKVHKATTRPVAVTTPIICVGNLVAGGTGKTPVCLSLGEILQGRNGKPCFLSKGYRGKLDGPIQVNPKTHTHIDVGDEPLLLAACAPTFVAKDRKAGALAASKSGAQVIIMDDGFQNPGLAKTLSLVVVDGGYGFGNQRIIPAGPLRENIDEGLRRADAVVVLGQDEFNVEMLVSLKFGLPVLKARLELEPIAPGTLKKPFVAFAGIGRPEKFFKSLEAAGATLVNREAFPDHHVFRDQDVQRLSRMAKLQDAQLVTTTKDYVRLPAILQEKVLPLPVKVVWQDPQAVLRLLDKVTA